MSRQNNRNDIAIGIEKDGSVYIAQGNPGIVELLEKDLVDYEEGLFYSQLNSRCVVSDGKVLELDKPGYTRMRMRHHFGRPNLSAGLHLVASVEV